MRLLNVKSRQLRTFYKNIPPYAILSHTWDQADPEVSYEDMKRQDHISMKGYSLVVCDESGNMIFPFSFVILSWGELG